MIQLTGANRNDSQQALALVDAILPLQGDRGRPHRRPDCVLGDRGYDAEAIRRGLRARRIMPWLAKRNTEHGSGLGRWRWVVERTFAWLNQFRRLRVRYEKRADIHEAFLSLGCALICWRFLRVDLVGGVKVSFARNALTCRRLAPSMVASTHRPSQVIGQTISHYRSDPKMLARLWSDDLVVTNPLNKVVNSISVLSEEKHCSRHIPI